MTGQILIDAGPLAALLNAREAHHEWAQEVVRTRRPPFLTCEPVIAEACHLLSHIAGAKEGLLELIERRLLRCPMRIENEAIKLRRLIMKYQDLPMSLADACLVRLAELHANATVVTLDGQFTVYRKHGRQTIATLMPGV